MPASAIQWMVCVDGVVHPHDRKELQCLAFNREAIADDTFGYLKLGYFCDLCLTEPANEGVRSQCRPSKVVHVEEMSRIRRLPRKLPCVTNELLIAPRE